MKIELVNDCPNRRLGDIKPGTVIQCDLGITWLVMKDGLVSLRDFSSMKLKLFDMDNYIEGKNFTIIGTLKVSE